MALPDGPKGGSNWQMLRWVATPFSFMRACSRQYGDCFTIRLSERFGPLVLFSHPEALQLILTNDDGGLFEAPGTYNVTLEPMTGTQSVFGLSGEQHRRARQLLMPPFLVTGCIYLAHRRAQVYRDPEEFRPERFLERHYSPFEFLPFGGGIRRCIGSAFAQFEMKLVLGNILSRFDLALADGRRVRHQRRGLVSGPSPFQMRIIEEKRGVCRVNG